MSEEKAKSEVMKRVEADDPFAMCQMGSRLCIEGDYSVAFEYLTRAAELGDAEAHYNLASMYGDEKGVKKDKKKEIFHLEEAAIGGHPRARHMLGCKELDNVKFERAKKHFIIAARFNRRAEEWLYEGTCQQRGVCRGSSCTPGCRRCNEKSTEGGSRCRHRSRRSFESGSLSTFMRG